MNRNVVFHVSVLVLVIFVLSTLCIKANVKATNGLPVHNLDTGLDYATIQSAIDASETKDGHSIRVDAGTYNESVSITKMLSITGQEPSTTNINGHIGISASNVSVTKFSIKGRVIFGSAVADCTFSQNILSYTGEGDGALYVRGHSNVISENTIKDCKDVQGIYLASAYQCTIHGNEIRNNTYGIFMRDSSFINVTRNLIYNSSAVGLVLNSTDSSLIVENTLYDNLLYAIEVSGKSNIIYHNDFLNNGLYEGTNKQARVGDYKNFWDNGTEGNFWDDYNGADEDKNGVGDSPYVIDLNNQDSFPLMARFIPEFPALIILPLVATTMLIVALFRKRKAQLQKNLAHKE